jgi:methionine synthase II (cobalamin-independent)
LVHFHKRQKFVAGEQSLKRELSQTEYDNLLRKETEETIRFQEESGIDVLVHGEFERYGRIFWRTTGRFRYKNGWVQSYGSRCVNLRLFMVMITPKSNDSKMGQICTIAYSKMG